MAGKTPHLLYAFLGEGLLPRWALQRQSVAEDGRGGANSIYEPVAGAAESLLHQSVTVQKTPEVLLASVRYNANRTFCIHS